MPWEETWILGILGCGLGRKGGGLSGSRYGLIEGGGFIPESYKSCRVLCASCSRPIRLLGLNTELNCPFRVFALSGSSEYVLPLAFRDVIPPESCLECLRREYNFLVLTLGTVYITIRKKICDFRWCNGSSLHLNASQNILRMGQNMFFKKYILPVINYKKEIKHEVCLSFLVYYDALKCIR